MVEAHTDKMTWKSNGTIGHNNWMTKWLIIDCFSFLAATSTEHHTFRINYSHFKPVNLDDLSPLTHIRRQYRSTFHSSRKWKDRPDQSTKKINKYCLLNEMHWIEQWKSDQAMASRNTYDNWTFSITFLFFCSVSLQSHRVTIVTCLMWTKRADF